MRARARADVQTATDFEEFEENLSTFASDPASELDILRHDGDTLSVDGAKVGVLEEADQIGLAGLLQRHHSGTLETQIGLEILSDLANQPLEWQLADQELGALLVAADLTEGDGAGPVTMRLLDTAGSRRALAGSFRRQLFPGRLATGRFTGGLLRTCHDRLYKPQTQTNKQTKANTLPITTRATMAARMAE